MTPDDLERAEDLPATAVPGQQAMFGVQITTISQGYQGLPPVEQLREYDGVVPGLAERIVRVFERPGEMAEAQMHQRHEVERLALTNDFAMRKSGWCSGS